MASNELAGDIQSLESRAESILAEARARASELLRDANLEAAKIMAERPSLGSVKAECAAIVEKARADAEAMLARAKKDAEKIATRARSDGGKALKDITGRIVSTVRGER